MADRLKQQVHLITFAIWQFELTYCILFGCTPSILAFGNKFWCHVYEWFNFYVVHSLAFIKFHSTMCHFLCRQKDKLLAAASQYWHYKKAHLRVKQFYEEHFLNIKLENIHWQNKYFLVTASLFWHLEISFDVTFNSDAIFIWNSFLIN